MFSIIIRSLSLQQTDYMVKEVWAEGSELVDNLIEWQMVIVVPMNYL